MMVGGDDADENMIKEECLSNDDSGNFTNGADSEDDGIEITVPAITPKIKVKVREISH